MRFALSGAASAKGSDAGRDASAPMLALVRIKSYNMQRSETFAVAKDLKLAIAKSTAKLTKEVSDGGEDC